MFRLPLFKHSLFLCFNNWLCNYSNTIHSLGFWLIIWICSTIFLNGSKHCDLQHTHVKCYHKKIIVQSITPIEFYHRHSISNCIYTEQKNCQGYSYKFNFHTCSAGPMDCCGSNSKVIETLTGATSFSSNFQNLWLIYFLDKSTKCMLP